jgi:Trk-type K+ transport system membrane component
MLAHVSFLQAAIFCIKSIFQHGFSLSELLSCNDTRVVHIRVLNILQTLWIIWMLSMFKLVRCFAHFEEKII